MPSEAKRSAERERGLTIRGIHASDGVTTYRRSIAVFPYRVAEPRFLLLRRSARRGGFWQPVTGRVETDDGLLGARARYASVVAGCRIVREARETTERENLLAAALREMEEETGIEDVLTVVDLGVEARFQGLDGAPYAERSFAAQVPEDAVVALSVEHEEARWCTLDEATSLLQWEENREALRRLARFLNEPEPPGA